VPEIAHGRPLRLRLVPLSLVSGLLAVTLAACAGVASSPAAGTLALPSSLASGASSPSSGSASSPSGGSREVIPVDELLAEASAHDGQIVAVDGDVLADRGSAHLCSFLDVAPEIHCDPRIRLTGTIPADTLASLEFYPARNLWYGYVVVIGTFDASGADGQPTVEIHEIFLTPSGVPEAP
jgi:hypothetical protein